MTVLYLDLTAPENRSEKQMRDRMQYELESYILSETNKQTKEEQKQNPKHYVDIHIAMADLDVPLILS